MINKTATWIIVLILLGLVVWKFNIQGRNTQEEVSSPQQDPNTKVSSPQPGVLKIGNEYWVNPEVTDDVLLELDEYTPVFDVEFE